MMTTATEKECYLCGASFFGNSTSNVCPRCTALAMGEDLSISSHKNPARAEVARAAAALAVAALEKGDAVYRMGRAAQRLGAAWGAWRDEVERERPDEH